jgi:hypothetical protein
MDEIKVSFTFFEVHELLHAVQFAMSLGYASVPIGISRKALASALTKLADAHVVMDPPEEPGDGE